MYVQPIQSKKSILKRLLCLHQACSFAILTFIILFFPCSPNSDLCLQCLIRLDLDPVRLYAYPLVLPNFSRCRYLQEE